MPNCECSDWERNRLPCKHFFAVFTHFENWGFQQLPVHYKESPFLTLDHEIIFSKEPFNPFEELNECEDMASTEATASPCTSAMPDVRPSEIPQRQKCSRGWNTKCKEGIKNVTSLLHIVDSKIIHGLCPAYLSSLLQLYQPQRSLRSSSTFYCPYCELCDIR